MVDQSEVPNEDGVIRLADLPQASDPDSPWKDIPHKSTGFIKGGTTMQVYVSEDMAHRLKKAASRLGVSRSELVRVACRTFMENNGLWSLRGPERNRE